jgi:hypothetical protein
LHDFFGSPPLPVESDEKCLVSFVKKNQKESGVPKNKEFKMHELCHALPQCHKNSTATLGISGALTAPDFSGRHLQGEPRAMPWVLWVQLPV